jgi:hypothetical protein
MRGKYPEVHAQQNAARYAQGKWFTALGKGEKPTHALYERCLQEARRDVLGVREPRASGGQPTQGDRAKLASSPSRGSGGAPGKTVVTISAAEDKMAAARFPGIPIKEARQKFIAMKAKRAKANKTA